MVKKKRKSRHRPGKWKWIIPLVIILPAILAFSLNALLEDAVRKKLSGYIRQDRNRIYDIQIKDVKINIWKGDFMVSHIRIKPRTDSLFETVLRSYAYIDLDTFRIRGLDVRGLLLENRLSMDKIELISPGTRYYLDTSVVQVAKESHVPLKEILSRQFQSASVGQFNFSNAAVMYYNMHDSVPVFFADSITMHISFLLIDTLTLDKRIPFHCREIDFSLQHLEFTSMEYYRIGIGRLKILSNENVLMVNDFCFTPKYSKEEFNKRIPYETDWFELTIAQLVLKGFDLDLYEESGMFGVDTLSIIQPEVTIFRDKHTADPPFKYKPLFGSSIRGIPAKVNIPNIILSNGHLIYQEISEKGTIPGQIELNDLSISGSNLTNDSTRWIDNPVFSLILDAKLNGKGKLNMNMDVIIPDSNDTFTVTGALGKMPLISLNTFIENNLFVSIESGELKKMAFSFVSDDDRSYGSMDFEYTDLKGVLIDPGNNKNKKLVSAAVNTFIRNDNIKDTRGYKKGKISVERRKDKGFANYLLKSLLSGMTSSAVPLLDKKQEKAKDKKEQKKRK